MQQCSHLNFNLDACRTQIGGDRHNQPVSPLQCNHHHAPEPSSHNAPWPSWPKASPDRAHKSSDLACAHGRHQHDAPLALLLLLHNIASPPNHDISLCGILCPHYPDPSSPREPPPCCLFARRGDKGVFLPCHVPLPAGCLHHRYRQRPREL
jgi:hypothetical protein